MPWKCWDEFLDAFIDRPVASMLVSVLKRLPASPDFVTLLAMIVGTTGGVLLALGHTSWAAACIVGAVVLDCADGQLARARGGGTELGRILDGAADYVVGVSVHVGLFVFLLRLPDAVIGPWTAFGLAAASGAGMALHSLILDYHKNLHWGRGTVARPERRGLLVRVYGRYVRVQEAIAGVPETSCALLRGIAVFGPTTRLWIIAAVAIHPYAIFAAVAADAYLIGLMWAMRSNMKALRRAA